MKPPLDLRHRRRNGAFTLIELIVVIAILATLAGLVISRVDFARRQADMAAAAATTAELSRNIQMYTMTKGVLPDGMDSLLSSSDPTKISKWIYDSSPSLVPKQSGGNTVIADVSSDVLGSLGRMGVVTVMDLADSATFASDAGTVARSIDRKVVAKAPLLFIKPGSNIWYSVFPKAIYGTVATGATGDVTTDGGGVRMPTQEIVTKVGDGSSDQVRNPSYGINTEVYLAVLGVGKGCAMNGVTITNPPLYPAPDPDSRYYRYVALVALYGDGRRAQFKAVLDPFGRTNADDIKQYIEAKPQ